MISEKNLPTLQPLVHDLRRFGACAAVIAAGLIGPAPAMASEVEQQLPIGNVPGADPNRAAAFGDCARLALSSTAASRFFIGDMQGKKVHGNPQVTANLRMFVNLNPLIKFSPSSPDDSSLESNYCFGVRTVDITGRIGENSKSSRSIIRLTATGNDQLTTETDMKRSVTTLCRNTGKAKLFYKETTTYSEGDLSAQRVITSSSRAYCGDLAAGKIRKPQVQKLPRVIQ